MSPLERSLSYLRRDGWLAEKVERPMKVPGRPFFRRDLFKVADIVAVHPLGHGVTFVQVCSSQHKAAAIAKLKSEVIYKNVRVLVDAGNRVVVHSWGLRVVAARRTRYVLTEEAIG